jgi:hypothetical protein
MMYQGFATGFESLNIPIRLAFGLPVHVAAFPAAPFSTSLAMTSAKASLTK